MSPETMTPEEAGQLVDQVAGRVLRTSLEPGALRHVLIWRVMAGWRPEEEAEIRHWLAAETGLRGLRRLPPPADQERPAT